MIFTRLSDQDMDQIKANQSDASMVCLVGTLSGSGDEVTETWFSLRIGLLSRTYWRRYIPKEQTLLSVEEPMLTTHAAMISKRRLPQSQEPITFRQILIHLEEFEISTG